MANFSFRKILILLLILAVSWLGIRFLLPLILPFLLAGLLAMLSEPLVKELQQRLRFPRGVASFLGITVSLLLALSLLVGTCALLIRELGALVDALPDFGEAIGRGLESLKDWLLGVVQKLPDNIGSFLASSIEGLFSQSSALPEQITSLLMSFAGVLIKGLPDSALSIGTWVLASYMFSARLPSIREWIGQRIPSSWHERYFAHWNTFKKSVGGWFFAQTKLVGITFLILCAGFFLLQISYPILWAGGICLVDILPILGTGTVLIPWGLICFLQENTLQGIGLLVIYFVITLVRSVLEPRLVGKELGLDPLVTLLAIYAGYRLWGLLGMLLFPILAVVVTQILLHAEKQV